MSRVLIMKGVKKSYSVGKKKIEVLKGINFELDEGEKVAITGVSGVGKTTFLYLIGGIERPDDGEIILDGINITSLDENELARIRGDKVAYIFQFFHLLPDFNVLENVLLPLMIRRRSLEGEFERVRALLTELGLNERLEHLPSELSGGEQQRVGIARALIMSPKIILADEPTGNLDPQTAEAVFNALLSSVKMNGCSLVLATHNPRFAERMDRVFRIEDGYLMEVK